MNDYNLVFWEKETGKKFLGKRIGTDYRLKDPETGSVLAATHYRVRKSYMSDPQNHKLKLPRNLPRRTTRGGVVRAKAWRAYLDGVA